MNSFSLQAYPKTCRLLTKRDFDHLKKDSSRIFVHPIVCFYKPSLSTSCSRLGISVSTKIGKSHTRNRIKRIIREYFRKDCHIRTKQADLLLVLIKAPSSELELENSLRRILDKL